jgi:Xaa-Pro aminopeptidase
MRLVHDEDAIAQLRWAAEVTGQAHVAAMKAGATATNEVQVFGAAMAAMRAQGHEDSFGPIGTMHGEILHNIHHDHDIDRGGLLLADMGSETPEGWAGDVTRTWPVSGTFSASQRAMYELVLSAEKACVQMVRPGVRYRDIHEKAKRVIVEGLRDLGIFRGEVDGLLERGAAALLFPHGVGHLLGLDVHDMEDLGDRAGYAPGRSRSPNFGDAYLRLDRDLEPGMAVTIEPGIYLVPAIYNDERYAGPLGSDFDKAGLLERFGDVRGIRIEDDVLVTTDGSEVLTSAIPKEADAVEAVIRSAAS